MIRTMVCQKSGCSGNKFYMQSDDTKSQLTCNQCNSKYTIENDSQEFVMLPNCVNCNNDIFKVFRDIDKKRVYAKCTECGGEPEKIYIDSDGIQVTYEAKLLNDIKAIMNLVEQRIYNLEVKIQDLESGQGLLEQSLAYINRFLVDKN